MRSSEHLSHLLSDIKNNHASAYWVGLAVQHCSDCLLDLFESAAHRWIVNAKVRGNLRSGYR